MKKVEIKSSEGFLHGFEPNDQYAKQARGIQTSPHNASEYNSVWGTERKAFDLITAKGYLATLCDEIRWGKCSEKSVMLRFYEE